MGDLTNAEIEALEKLEKEATARGSKCWAKTDLDDGTAHVYSPSLGPLRQVVPVADATTADALFIVELRNAAPRLLQAAKRANELEAWVAAYAEGKKP